MNEEYTIRCIGWIHTHECKYIMRHMDWYEREDLSDIEYFGNSTFVEQVVYNTEDTHQTFQSTMDNT